MLTSSTIGETFLSVLSVRDVQMYMYTWSGGRGRGGQEQSHPLEQRTTWLPPRNAHILHGLAEYQVMKPYLPAASDTSPRLRRHRSKLEWSRDCLLDVRRLT